MVYNILITDEAKREIRKKIDKSLLDRLDKAINKLSLAPESYGKPLHYPLVGFWETYFDRRYRILYKIDINTRTITIEAIKHKDDM